MRFPIGRWPAVMALCLLALLLMMNGHSTAAWDVPAAVTLQYFRGTGLDRAVRLEWATGTELSTAGFRFERSANIDGPFQPLADIGFVQARGDGVGGAEYFVTDSDGLVNGRTYWYVLYEIEYDSSENPADPISVTAGLATAAPTVSPMPTSTSAGLSVTPTASATSTVVQTPTGDAGQVSTQPTATAPGGQATSTESAGQGGLQSQVTPESSPPGSSGPAENLAQALTPTSASGYPVQPVSTPLPPAQSLTIDAAGYPGASPQEPLLATEPYPAENLGAPENGTPLPQTITTIPASAIGSGSAATLSPVTELDSSDRPSSSTFVLWLGFLTALLIFATGVIGSIVFFTRERGRSR